MRLEHKATTNTWCRLTVFLFTHKSFPFISMYYTWTFLTGNRHAFRYTNSIVTTTFIVLYLNGKITVFVKIRDEELLWIFAAWSFDGLISPFVAAWDKITIAENKLSILELSTHNQTSNKIFPLDFNILWICNYIWSSNEECHLFFIIIVF